jgi:hypothetical protein
VSVCVYECSVLCPKLNARRILPKLRSIDEILVRNGELSSRESIFQLSISKTKELDNAVSPSQPLHPAKGMVLQNNVQFSVSRSHRRGLSTGSMQSRGRSRGTRRTANILELMDISSRRVWRPTPEVSLTPTMFLQVYQGALNRAIRMWRLSLLLRNSRVESAG